MSESSTAEYPATWPDWVKEIMREFEASERPFIDWVEGTPEWVQRMASQTALSMSPTVSAHLKDTDGVALLGALVGHIKEQLSEEGSLMRLCKQILFTVGQAETRVIKKNKHPERKHVQNKLFGFTTKKAFANALVSVTEKKQRLAEKTKTLIDKQPIETQRKFADAYSKALGMDTIGEHNEVLHETFPGVTSIYVVLAMNWPSVEKAKNITVIYRYLVRMLGSQKVGSIDRIRQLLHRYGICLARPGRPNKCDTPLPPA